MTKHTIVIELDVPDGLESAVHDAAYTAIALINKDTEQRVSNAHDAANLVIYAFPGKTKPAKAHEAIDNLRVVAARRNDSAQIITGALSEIRHAMSIADAEYRRKQAQEQPK